MSDDELRRLERAAAAGDREAAERLRLVRRRLLSADRLRLAAYLGDPPARELLGADAPDPPAELGAWLRALAGWGPLTALAVYAAALEPLDEAQEESGDDPSGHLRSARLRVLTWCRDPEGGPAPDCAYAGGGIPPIRLSSSLLRSLDHFTRVAAEAYAAGGETPPAAVDLLAWLGRVAGAALATEVRVAVVQHLLPEALSAP